MSSCIYKFTLIITILLLGISCANHRLNVLSSNDSEKVDVPPTDQSIKHRMFLVGETGTTDKEADNLILDLLKTELSTQSENTSIVFLGDNVLPKGVPSKSKKSRERAEKHMKQNLAVIDDFKGTPYFIPGDRDWGYGIDGLDRQEDYIEDKINDGLDNDDDDYTKHFFPRNGCPGPEIIDINDQLVLILIDSQWWVEDWDDEPKIHDGCEVKNKFMFKFLFENAVRKYRNKNVVVAMHHPLFSNGPHGGDFTARSHFFPLTDKWENAWIPLPVIGSLYTGVRKMGVSKKDITHPEFKTLKEVMMAAAIKNGNFIFVSAHENNLQYLENAGQKFINSGSARKTTGSNTGKGGLFGYGEKGYSVIDFYEDGQAWVQFFVPNKNKTGVRLVYQKQIKKPLSISEDNIPTEFPDFDSLKNQTTVRKVPSRLPITPVSNFHNTIFGEHYRDIYLQDYEFPILDITKFEGGLTPIKRGGGNQTNSLRLLDANGHQWQMRDMTKDATRFLPPPFNKINLAKFIAVDNFLSTHPFAPLAIPPLADAANIYSARPQIYYVPKQPGLGIYNDQYGGSVYLIEERAGGSWEGTDVYDGVKKTYNTPEVSEKSIKGHKHQIDEKWALRSRLFDVIIGDWDRHDDQWRWGRYKAENGDWIYRPIPRDRDQAFSKYDGWITRAATLASPFTHQLAVYQPEIKSIKWSAWSPRNFDAQFLSELDWEDWKAEADYLTENITDEVIDEAFAVWPNYALEQDGDYIKSVLRKRRDRIADYARRYYKFRAKKVDVVGTDDRDLFEIERLNNEETRVSMYELSKKGNKKDRYYQRTFKRSETKEIHIYGNGDDDKFVVTGDVDKGIKLRIIGGLGKDELVDDSRVSGLGKKTLFYDDKNNKAPDGGSEVKDKRTNRSIYNIYDRRAYQYEYNYTVPIPILGFNPDEGVLAGALFMNTTFGFKKAPYASRHRFGGTYAFATQSFNLSYLGDYLNTFGDLDFYLEASVRNPAFTFNYFGFGNDSPASVDDLGINFYRIRQGMIRLYPALKKRLGNVDNFLTLGPIYERTEIDDTPNRILTAGEEVQPENLFDQRNRLGAAFGLQFLNVDNRVIPARGVHFTSGIRWLNSLDNEELTFTRLQAELSIYRNLDKRDRLILALCFGGGHIFGDLNEDYFFDDAPSLGGESALRGYRQQRFYGNTVAWQNTDIRYKLFTSNNAVLPFTMGLYAGFDIGRVWADAMERESDVWHYSYGGGVWFTPVEAFALSLGVFVPREDTEEPFQIRFRGGFSF